MMEIMSVVVCRVLRKITGLVMGARTDEEQVNRSLDIYRHGEAGYAY
jgi:ammonia channel protein AmtB